jgi:23S rRNA pseudouridine1911/1915/1917 synthase
MTDHLVILFEDAHCLAVVKPAGILTQGHSSGEATLEDAVRRYLASCGADGSDLGTVHRLDRPVSGVVVWAKTTKAARRLSAAFADRRVAKEYWAVVEGDAQRLGETGAWDDWLSEPAESRVARLAAGPGAGARRAVTAFRVGRATQLPEGTSWLLLFPETGRTHQLRAQSSARGLPIIGDSAYGAGRAFPRGIALHARSLTVPHPVQRTMMTWTAPLPAAWAEAGIRI